MRRRKAQLNAEEAYSGSIGRWKRRVNDEKAVHAYYDFRDAALAKMAEEWLRDNGIVPLWT